jgi:LysM repeat protein
MMLKKRAKVAPKRSAGGAGSQTPLPAPAETRATVVIKKGESLHTVASDWGLSPELVKAWNPDAEFAVGDKVFIHPPKVD